jgi:hypothetical protein
VQAKAREWGATPDVPTVGKFSGLAEIGLWTGVIWWAVQIPNH